MISVAETMRSAQYHNGISASAIDMYFDMFIPTGDKSLVGTPVSQSRSMGVKETTPSQQDTTAIQEASAAAEQVDALSGYFGGAEALGGVATSGIGTEPPPVNMSFAQPNYQQVPSSTRADGVVLDQFGRPMAPSPLDQILMGGM